ncbi:MAG: hypothetical protein K0V04_07265 [Deltaproteobacteria bacterium]|nr:hypothetical protein [Deltaproteobacteria bacterium]
MTRSSMILAVCLAASGCSVYASPGFTAPGQLGLAYDDELQVYADQQRLAAEPAFEGLEDHVECVPRARVHARAARRHGRHARRLAWAGGSIGVASLGGLGGLALLDSNPKAAGAIVGTGLAVGVLGIILAGSARAHRNRAAGNAVDSVNYYNDDVRRDDSRCRRRTQQRVHPTKRFRQPAPSSSVDDPTHQPRHDAAGSAR